MALRRELQAAGRVLKAARSFDLDAESTRLAGPIRVQLQTVDRCNASCIMCPYADTARPGPAHRMPPDLFSSILRQLRALGTTRVFIPMFQNEPLIDNDLAGRVREARDVLGAAVAIRLTSNGALLTTECGEALFSAGLDNVMVSLDAATEETYRKIRHGLDFAQITRNVRQLLERGYGRRVTVSFLRQKVNEHELGEFVARWRSLGANVLIQPVNNRAGAVGRFEELRVGPRRGPRSIARRILHRLVPYCAAPFESLSILCDGRVVLCCNDWQIAAVVGDLSRQSVAEVWNGTDVNSYRVALCSGRSRDLEICRDCSLRAGVWGNPDNDNAGHLGTPEELENRV